MIILFLLFLMQFSIACACLAMNDSQRESVARQAWKIADKGLRETAQVSLDCCGFDDDSQGNVTENNGDMYHPPCAASKVCTAHHVKHPRYVPPTM